MHLRGAMEKPFLLLMMNYRIADSKEILEARRYKVLTAADGAEATALFASAIKAPLTSS